MGLRMATLIFCVFTEKSDIYGGSSQKTHIEGGLPKRGGGLGQFADLKGALARKRGWCF